jgi:hypothetical protein
MQGQYDSGNRSIDRDTARSSVAAPFLGIGGVVLVIGSLLTWVDQGDAAAGTEVAGTSLSDGRFVMGIGFAMIVMAVYMATTRRYGHWYDADLLGAALGAIATTVIVAIWIAIPDGMTADLGVYVSLVGAIIGLGGSIAALGASRADRIESPSVTRRAA